MLLDRLEQLTGLSFNEYKRLIFEENIEEFKCKLRPENIDREAEVEMKITGHSFDEVVTHWRETIQHWQNEIEKNLT